MKVFFFLLLLSQVLGAQINQFELNDYRRTIEPIGANLGTALSTHRESIKSLSTRLDQFQEKFNRIGTGIEQTNLLPSVKVENQNKAPYEIPSPTVFRGSGETKQVEVEIETDNRLLRNQSPRDRKLGFYLLPFMALQSSGNFRSEIFQSEIEQDMGFSSGWRMGVESPHFFIEGEFSYSRNKLKGSVVIPLLPPSFNPIKADGESEGFGVLLNAGGRFRLSDKIYVLIGAGFGAVNQEIGFDIASTLLEEEDTLFTYQLFTGLNFDLSDQFRLGLRYRWMKVGEMEDFSNRDLHLAELSMGYVF